MFNWKPFRKDPKYKHTLRGNDLTFYTFYLLLQDDLYLFNLGNMYTFTFYHVILLSKLPGVSPFVSQWYTDSLK